MKSTESVKKLLRSPDFRQPLLATIVALVFAPFSIYLGFFLNSYLSKPLLSIEYVHQEVQYTDSNKNKTRTLNNAITGTTWYQNYLSKAALNLGFEDIRRIAENSSPTSNGRLVPALKTYKVFLNDAKQKMEDQIQSIDKMDDADKFIALSVNENYSFAANEEDIDKVLFAALQKKVAEIVESEKLVDIALEHLTHSRKAVVYIVPERKWSFPPISTLNKNFNPRNTLCMPVVKIFICLELDEKSRFRSGTIYM